ncbi:MAG TPA: PIN domain-containing protein [Tepidisphaeraceae bacterium]|nr:PIN domain-containing protein [Tepidisphaeraceae bacterium]
MSDTTVVDAHPLLWYFEGNPKLSADGRRRLANPLAKLLVPTIALAEVCWTIGKAKSLISVDDVRYGVTTDFRFAIVPLDTDLVFAAAVLPAQLEMHDRMIVATAARAHGRDPSVKLLTADVDIQRSGLVPTVW